MRGVLLDRHGQVEGVSSVEKVRRALELADAPGERFDRLALIQENLRRSGELGGPFEPRGSMQSWRETLYTVIADGAQILNTVTETVMVPDYTLPAGYLYPGRTLKWTLFFNTSTVITTPGTLILRLRYGGGAGTIMCASGAYAPDPTAAATNLTGYVEYYFVCRAVGTAAASIAMGRMWIADIDDLSTTTIVGNLGMHAIPAATPATVNINTTTANALSPTAQFSVATATTQLTCNVAVLEALT